MGRKALTYTLVSTGLRERFGEIFGDTTFQDRHSRVGFLRRKSDKTPLTYHVVTFFEPGIKQLGRYHDEIVDGGLLGEVIERSGIPHRRMLGKPSSVRLPTILAEIFGTQKTKFRKEIITYWVNGERYCKIRQYYNPDFTPAA